MCGSDFSGQGGRVGRDCLIQLRAVLPAAVMAVHWRVKSVVVDQLIEHESVLSGAVVPVAVSVSLSSVLSVARHRFA